ncbi:MAG: hypothetical protein BYD32DRAFT_364983, partial [Podila humilis]
WVNNPTLTEFCFSMIGRADIEGSKSNVVMNAWLPQASYYIYIYSLYASPPPTLLQNSPLGLRLCSQLQLQFSFNRGKLTANGLCYTIRNGAVVADICNNMDPRQYWSFVLEDALIKNNGQCLLYS